MNISEVYMLSHNYRVFYAKIPYSFLDIPIGDHAWYLDKDAITKSSNSYTPQELVEWLFYWVFG